jgi:hypothetical protein
MCVLAVSGGRKRKIDLSDVRDSSAGRNQVRAGQVGARRTTGSVAVGRVITDPRSRDHLALWHRLAR